MAEPLLNRDNTSQDSTDFIIMNHKHTNNIYTGVTSFLKMAEIFAT